MVELPQPCASAENPANLKKSWSWTPGTPTEEDQLMANLRRKEIPPHKLSSAFPHKNGAWPYNFGAGLGNGNNNADLPSSRSSVLSPSLGGPDVPRHIRLAVDEG